jgi:hypothetical protein
MSVGIAKELGNSSASWFNLSLERAARATFAPRLASSLAVASPIPELAPVMITTLSLISICGNYTRGLPVETEGKEPQLAQHLRAG